MSENEKVDNDENIPAQVKATPKQIDSSKPSYTIPLEQLNPGKAGVSDLFDKINEVIRYINALEQKPKAL